MTRRSRAALRAEDVGMVAVPFWWLGLVVAISFVETPLKFTAPGITLPLGLQIGRVVFPVLNLLEVVSAVVLAAAMVSGRRRRPISRSRWLLLGGLWAVLLTQVLALRPALDERATVIIAGGTVPTSPWHLVYIALDVLVALGLIILGVGNLHAVAAADDATRTRPAHHLQV